MKKSIIAILSLITIIFCGFIAHKPFPLNIIIFEIISIIVLFTVKDFKILKIIILLRIIAALVTIFSFYPQNMFSETVLVVIFIYSSLIGNSILTSFYAFKIQNTKKTILTFSFAMLTIILCNVYYFEINSNSEYIPPPEDLSLKIYKTISEKIGNTNYDSITEIEISKQNFKTIPADLYKLKNLKTLKIKYLNTDNITPQFKELKKIKNIIIFSDSNNIISPNILLNENIIFLSYENSNLMLIDNDIKKLKNLESISVTNSKLEKISYELWELPKLVAVTIIQNPIKSITCKKIGKSLDYVDLSYNYLQEIPSLISSQTITYLRLNNNLIENYKNNDGIGTKLTNLNLQNNLLSKIPFPLKNTKLKILNLTGNKITKLPDDIYALESLTDIYLYKNPIIDFDPQKFNFKNNISTISIDISCINKLNTDAFNGFSNIRLESDFQSKKITKFKNEKLYCANIGPQTN